jgi:hypothetical protein
MPVAIYLIVSCKQCHWENFKKICVWVEVCRLAVAAHQAKTLAAARVAGIAAAPKRREWHLTTRRITFPTDAIGAKADLDPIGRVVTPICDIGS